MLRSVANAAHAHMNATLEPLGAGSVRLATSLLASLNLRMDLTNHCLVLFSATGTSRRR